MEIVDSLRSNLLSKTDDKITSTSYKVKLNFAKLIDGVYRAYRTVTVDEDNDILVHIKDYIERFRAIYPGLGDVDISLINITNNILNLLVRVNKTSSNLDVIVKESREKRYRLQLVTIRRNISGTLYQFSNRTLVDDEFTMDLDNIDDMYKYCSRIFNNMVDIDHYLSPSVDCIDENNIVTFELTYYQLQ